MHHFFHFQGLHLPGDWGGVMGKGPTSGENEDKRPNRVRRAPLPLLHLGFKMKTQFPTENSSRHPTEENSAGSHSVWVGHRVPDLWKVTGFRRPCIKVAARSRPHSCGCAPCANNAGLGREWGVFVFFSFNSKLILTAP